jgi:hypothetical protein
LQLSTFATVSALSGHDQFIEGQLCANNGLMHCSKTLLFSASL